MIRRIFFYVAVTLLFALSANCTVNAPPIPITVTLTQTPNGFIYAFGNGQIAQTPQEAETLINQLTTQGYRIGKIDFHEAENSTDHTQGLIRHGLKVSLPWTDKHIIVKWLHRGHVGGQCIRRTAHHFNFIINETGGRLIADLHVAGWRQNGRVCIGFYLTPHRWEKCFCSPTYDEVQSAVQNALTIVIGTTAAAYAAYVLTPIIMSGLVLAI